MTDKPARTMTLQPYEWRSLVATGANNVYSFIGALQPETPPNADQMTWLHETLDRLKMQVSAWAASGQPLPTATDAQASQTAMSHHLESTNGTGSVSPSGPKKKRGWQKGRKRGPRKPRTDEAVQ